MRVISQDGCQSIEFSDFVFSVVGNIIVCDKDIITAPSEIGRRVIAKYSTAEKAHKAMESMNDRYVCSESIWMASDLRRNVIASYHQDLIEDSIVFRFPVDEEIEV